MKRGYGSLAFFLRSHYALRKIGASGYLQPRKEGLGANTHRLQQHDQYLGAGLIRRILDRRSLDFVVGVSKIQISICV